MAAMNTVSRAVGPSGDDGTSTVEMALLAPLIASLIGMALLTGWAGVNLALLDRAAEIVAREVSIDGDQARALAEAESQTPLATIASVAVIDEATGAPLTGTPTAGQRYAATVTATMSMPAASLIAFVPGAQAVDGTLVLTRTARGLGQ